jgi:dTDP-4-dehydrorhamnose reductase
VRTAWVYGHVGRNFVATIRRKLQTDEVVPVVTDQVGSPSYTVDLAQGLTQLVAQEVSGLWHLTNSGACSWFELAQAIAPAVGADPRRVQPITSAQLRLRACRPAYSVLANTAWEAFGAAPLRPWQDALQARLARHRG